MKPLPRLTRTAICALFACAVVNSPICAQSNVEEQIRVLQHQLQWQQQLLDEQRHRLNAMEVRRLPAVELQPARYGAGTIAAEQDTAKAENGDDEKQDDEKPKGLAFGYDGGFIISSPDDTDVDTDGSDFLMRIGSWAHFRHHVFDSFNSNRDRNDFEFERLRLVFNGHAFSSDFQYFFQFDGDTDSDGDRVDVLDYYVSYDIGRDVMCREKGKLGVRVGKWKIPFNRDREESGTRLQFADRSMAGVFFDIQRSLGIGLYGEQDTCFAPVEWRISLFNGINTGGFRPIDLDRNLAVATRLTSVVVGDYGNDGEPDLDYRLFPALRLGTGFAFSRVDRQGLREFRVQRAVDSGDTIESLLPPSVNAYDVYLFATDAHLKYRGSSLIAEYYMRYLTSFSGAPIADLFDYGLLVQSGYFVIPKKLELLARWSRIVGNSATLGALNESADEFAGGVAWYIRGHNLKVVFDVTRVNGAPINDAALNILAGDDGWLYRTQFQWKF